MSVAPVTATSPAIPADRIARIHKTAQQFEAIFVRQMLSAARKSNLDDTEPTGPGTGSHGADSFLDMQDARFADIAAQKGAFGLAHMIEQRLLHQQGLDPATAPKKPAKEG